ncbi:MAG: glutamate--tRNA ligase family protein, partial [Gammaproteobacteria bacterium]
MTGEKITTRFAPSPTGLLHLGNVRTALFNWLFARKVQGAFLLRIEDTDRARESDSALDALIDDLIWLGLQWDEGFGAGGAGGPYRQSERTALYAKYYEQLQEQGLAYPCFCSPSELALARKTQLAAGQ